MGFNLKEYINVFIEETVEYIEQLDILLTQFEKAQFDKNLLKNIYRIMHTLKGISGIVGFDDLSNLMHGVESLLDLIIKDEITVGDQLYTELYHLTDILKDIINTLKKGNEIQVDFKKEIDRFHGFAESQTKAKQEGARGAIEEGCPFDIENYKDAIGKSAYQDKKIHCLSFVIAADEELKDSRRRILFRILSPFGLILDYFPKRKNDYFVETGLVIKVLFVGDITDELIKGAERVDRISGFRTEEFKPAAAKAPEGEKREQILTENMITSVTDESTIKVKVKKLDNLLNYAQELTILHLTFQNILNKIRAQSSAKEVILALASNLDVMGKTTQSLHTEILATRMVPIGNLFRRFIRPTRDMARAYGKKVNLRLSGEETEIDKNAIDRFFEPLLHLVRNAIVHGIEAPGERELFGKDTEANLDLKAYTEQDKIYIEVTDDGTGIDFAKVRAKALSIGLLAENKDFAREEMINLLFSPNFSTKEVADEFGGRGVGLNIVKEAIKEYNGNITVQSDWGKGTSFIISLPTSLSIVSALIVEASGEKYAIPLSGIKEIISLKPEQVKSVYRKKVCQLRDKTLPIIRLEEFFEIEHKPGKKPDITLLVIESEGMAFGLMVENILEKQEIVTKSLANTMAHVEGVNGVTILGDGTVVLIIDVSAITRIF